MKKQLHSRTIFGMTRRKNAQLGPSWDRLPSAVQENILLRLSVSDACRLRCTCKLWNNTLQWKNLFLSDIFSQFPCLNWVLMCHSRVESQFSPYEFLDYAHVWCPGRGFHFPFPEFVEGERVRACAAAGGLICLEVLNGAYDKLLVGNPAINVWKKISMAQAGIAVARSYTMVVNSALAAYYIHCESEDFSEVYSSITECWENICEHGQVPRKKLEGPCFAATPIGWHDALAYDTQQRCWADKSCTVPCSSWAKFKCFQSRTILKCGERLLLAAYVVEESDDKICLWDLQSGESLLADSLKEIISNPICYSSVYFSCANDLLVLSGENGTWLCPALAYDLKVKSWHTFQCVPGLVVSKTHIFCTSFAAMP